jgi:hypothetical protein
MIPIVEDYEDMCWILPKIPLHAAGFSVCGDRGIPAEVLEIGFWSISQAVQ